MSIFGNIQNASISQSGPKLPDGFSGILEVTSVTLFKGHTGVRYLVETVVHETNLPAEAPVGYRPSWAPDMAQANTQGNVLCFLASCFGIDPKLQEAEMRSKITPQIAEYSFSQAQPCRGRFVHCETKEIQTRQNRDFMTHRWSPTPKTFASRINDANVAPTASAAPSGAPSFGGPPGGMPTMPTAPGGFVPPTGGFGPGPGASTGFGAPGGFPPAGGAPGGFPAPTASAAPSLPTVALPGMPGPAASPPPFSPPSGFGAPGPTPNGFGAPGGTPGLPASSPTPSFPPTSAPQLPQMPQSGPPGFGMAQPPGPAFPPPGWAPSAQYPGYFQHAQLGFKTEADLRAGR